MLFSAGKQIAKQMYKKSIVRVNYWCCIMKHFREKDEKVVWYAGKGK